MSVGNQALDGAIAGEEWAAVADMLLRDAHAAALPLGEDERARRQAFNAVIARQCETGAFDAALRTADATTDYHRIECLKIIAQAESKSGRRVAVDALMGVQAETGRQLTEAAEAVASVAQTLGDAGAELLARVVRDGWPTALPELRPHALAPLAIGYARLGKFAAALELITGFSPLADETWYELAREQVRQGHADDASKTATRIDNPSRQRQARIEIALRTHDMEQARTIAREAEEVRSRETRLAQAYPELDTILARLSREYLEAGRIEDALACIADIQRPQLRAMEMAQVQVEQGHIDEALALTEGMDGTSARDFALLAAVTKRTHDKAVAAGLNLVAGINNIETRDRARAVVIEGQCQAGDFEAAFATMNSIQGEKYLAVALGTLVSALFEAKRRKAAVALMAEVPKALLAGLEPVLRSLLRQNDHDSLQHILPRCAESLAPAWRFCSVLVEVHPQTVEPLAAVVVRY